MDHSIKMRNRRKHFLVDKRLQFHYLFYMTITITAVSGVGMTGSYFGIWNSVVKTFSEESLRESITTAAQINEYEQARRPMPEKLALSTMRLFQETALLSERQKEMIREIMDKTNRKMLYLGILLIVLIGWGSIFLTHKIAGPLLKFGRHCQKLGTGNLTVRIELRKFDEAHWLAKEFNEMSAQLDRTIAKMKRIVRQAPRGTVPEELKEELAKFKTTSD